MADSRFFDRAGTVTLQEICGLTGASLTGSSDPDFIIEDAAPLEMAGPSSISFLEARKHLAQLTSSEAGACFLPEDLAGRVEGAKAALLVTPDPKAAYAKLLTHLYAERSWRTEQLISPGAHIDPSAQLEEGVCIQAGASIGPHAQIGSGTMIGPGAVIGAGVSIGRDGYVGANATIQCALIGDRVRIHPGAAIGQDGFGYAFSGGVHHKIPQVGRVVIQHDVEVGANTTIDRGASGDTLIGEGTKIDNLVQIGHNCRIGRGCIIVSQVGLSGTTILEDYVVLGGQVGTAGHLTIGMGAQVAAQSGVPRDIPAGEIHGGTPSKPILEWKREVAMLSRMVKARRTGKSKD